MLVLAVDNYILAPFSCAYQLLLINHEMIIYLELPNTWLTHLVF